MFSDQCKSCIVDGCVAYCELRQKYMQELRLDAQSRKKAKWTPVPGRLGDEVECNQCHSVFWYWMGNYRFCPSCGARMEGESDETDYRKE